MQSRKVWKFLSLLSPRYQQAWLRYLAFRFGEKQVYLRKLATLLVSAFPDAPSDQDVWADLYPGEAYDDGRLRKLSGDLTHQLELYLSYQSFEDSPLDLRIQLVNNLVSQPDADLFGQTWKKVCKDVYRLAGSAAELAEYRYQLEVLNREYRVRHRMKDGAFWVPPQEPWWGDADSLQRIAYLNTAWDLYRMMDLVVNAEITYSNTGKRPDIPLAQEYLAMAESHPVLSRFPLVGLYLGMVRLYDPESPADPAPLSRFLFVNEGKLPDTEKHLLFSSLLNQLVIRLNKGENQGVVSQLLDLYEFGIQAGLLLYEGLLLPGHYKNFLGLCLRIKDTVRARAFLEDYKALLPDDVKEDLPALNRIYLSFAEKDYAKTIQLASHSRFSRSLDEIDARAVLLQAHYESGERDPDWLDGQIQALIRYTRNRTDISDSFKQTYVARFRLYRRFFLASTAEELSQIHKIVQESPAIDKGGWLRDHL